MQVDSSVELGRDDPALEFPWCSEDGCFRYQDLKSDPALINKIPEARDCQELREFLLRINAPDSALQTVKADLWQTGEISPEEQIFTASRKTVSYIDLIFADPAMRLSLQSHLNLVEKLCNLLRRAPEIPAAIEFVARHCHYHDAENIEAGRATDTDPITPQNAHRSDSLQSEMNELLLKSGEDSQVGFCITAYVSGFADHDPEARQRWAIALKLLQNAIVQATSN